VTPFALRRLAAEQPLPMRVVGSCMAPTLCAGDIVAVEPARCYLPGDVIAFRQHRVLGYRRIASRWALLVQGDGCSSHDGAVFPEHVIGRARFSDGEARPLAVSLADRIRALGRWWRLALAWLARRLA